MASAGSAGTVDVTVTTAGGTSATSAADHFTYVAASKLVFTTAAQTLTAGMCSGALTVQSQDSLGNPSNPSSTQTLNLASSSTGGTFYADNMCTTAISRHTIAASGNSATFYYRDTTAGAPTLTVTGSGAF